jgi:hypothetical protein
MCFCFSLIQLSTFSLFMCECGHGLDAYGMHLAHCPFGSWQIARRDAIKKSPMPSFKGVGMLYGESKYALTLGASLWVDLYMTWEDYIFVADVVVIDPVWKIVALNVINWLTGATMEINAIVKICKYRGFHEGHHFIPMAMEVHGAPKHDMDHFIRECAHFFHDRWSGSHLSLSFYIQFFKQSVSIALQHALTLVINKKIMMACDVYSRPPIIIKSHDLHVDNIRGAMGEIASYYKRD